MVTVLTSPVVGIEGELSAVFLKVCLNRSDAIR